MQSVGISFLSFPLLLMFSSWVTLPLAGPPLPLDPVLSAVAPSECLLYLSSAGVAVADAESTNQTEQLFAEPEVRHFSETIQAQLVQALRRQAGNDRVELLLSDEIPKLVKALLTLPTAAFIEDFQANDDGFDLTAGLVLKAGNQRQEIEAAIHRLAELASENGTVIGTNTREGETWNVYRASMQMPEIRWGWRDNYFVLAAGNGSVERILARMRGNTPEWLETLRREQAVEREASLGYLNVARLLEKLQPFLEKRSWSVIEKLGLTAIKSAQNVTGFDERGCVTKAQLTTNGQREGLLSFLPHKPLSKRDFEVIPADALLAVAKRVDAKESWENIMRLVEAFSPRTVEQWEENLRLTETKLGVDIENDVLGSLDDVWTAHLPAGDFLTSWLRAAITCQVKDAARLRRSLETLTVDIQAKLSKNHRNNLELSSKEFEGQTIYTANASWLNCSPSWCVTDDHLVIGTIPQTVRGFIKRIGPFREDNSLADVPAVRTALSSADAPSVVFYRDTPSLVNSVYPLIQLKAQALSAQLERLGFALDVSSMPSQESLLPHLRPSVATFSHRQNGFYYESHHSLPSGGNAMLVAPLALGTTGFAWRMARPPRAHADVNNMRQIALAVLNYEAAHGELPSNIYDSDGKALLSWRVRILPFLDQVALYDRFRLDEPWDSPHNLPLSKTVIPAYASPQTPLEPKTRYLALAGETTLFRGQEPVRFREIRDGTSNTILIVKAAVSEAAAWSKPQDIEFDPKQPFRGLDRTGDRIFLTMCDGSCPSLSATVDAETLRALATRDGGEHFDDAVLNR